MDAENIFGQPALMNPEFDLIQDAELHFLVSVCLYFAVQVVQLSSQFVLKSTDVYSVTSTAMFRTLRLLMSSEERFPFPSFQCICPVLTEHVFTSDVSLYSVPYFRILTVSIILFHLFQAIFQMADSRHDLSQPFIALWVYGRRVVMGGAGNYLYMARKQCNSL